METLKTLTVESVCELEYRVLRAGTGSKGVV